MRQYAGKVAVIGMAGRDELSAMRAFVDRHELSDIPHAVDADGSLWAHFGVRAQPAWVFIDANGHATTEFGSLSDSELRQHLDAVQA